MNAKFRAWDKNAKKWYARVQVGTDCCHSVHDEELGWLEFDEHCGAVVQWTGLEDRNGKQIYEGDIVKGKRYVSWGGGHVRLIGKVIYRSPKFQIDGVGKYDGIFGEELHSAFEIIGNIYETPELIGGAC